MFFFYVFVLRLALFKFFKMGRKDIYSISLFKLPAGLRHSGNLAFVCHLAELVTANAKLAHVPAGATGKLATAMEPYSG
jgi:hypothetical protein